MKGSTARNSFCKGAFTKGELQKENELQSAPALHYKVPIQSFSSFSISLAMAM